MLPSSSEDGWLNLAPNVFQTRTPNSCQAAIPSTLSRPTRKWFCLLMLEGRHISVDPDVDENTI